MTDEDIDLGDGYSLEITSWAPDRSIPANAKNFDGVPDEPRFGGILTCPHIQSSITFDGPVQKKVAPNEDRWTVQSWEPLTLSPSIQSDCCHGFIRNGKWVGA